MLKPGVSRERMALRLKKILHQHASAARVSHTDKCCCQPNKYTHISVNKIDKNIKILELIGMIKRHRVLC